MFHGPVVGGEVVVAERPVDAHAVGRRDREVAGVEAQGNGGVVDGGAAHGTAGVDAAEGERVVAVADAQIVPVDPSKHGQLVVHEVGAGVEPVAGFEDDGGHAGLREFFGEHAAGGAGPDDAGVDGAVVVA